MLQGYIHSIQELSKTLVQGSNLDHAVEVLCREMTKLFNVPRASIWEYVHDTGDIHCMKLYERDSATFSEGVILSEINYPNYFKELKFERIIDASDARTDARTNEFTNAYLVPLNIVSMLDTPFFYNGSFGGVICLESFEERQWTMEEKLLSRSLGDLCTIALVQNELHAALSTIETQKEEISEINQSLEKRVVERTSALERQNDMLIEYSFINSHLLRGPICTLKGLVSLMRMDEMKSDRDLLINKMEEPILQLDGLSVKMKKALNEGEYLDREKLNE